MRSAAALAGSRHHDRSSDRRYSSRSAAVCLVGFSSDDPSYLGDQLISSRQYSEATQQLIDEEVQRLLKEAGGRATQLLSDHRDALDRLIDLLLEKETIDGDEVLAVAAGPAQSPQDASTLSHSASRPTPGQPPTA